MTENIEFKTVSSDLSVRIVYRKGKVIGAEHPPRLAGPILGFNADEQSRASKSNEYGSRGNDYLYPLIEAGLNREALLAEGAELTNDGHLFLKSACCECPFPSLDYIAARAASEPKEFARTVVREMQVLRLNPRMHQYGFGTSYWVAKTYAPEALGIARELWAAKGPWRIMRVQRITNQVPDPSKANPIKWKTLGQRCLTFADCALYTEYAAAEAALANMGKLNWVTQSDVYQVKYRPPSPKTKALSNSEKRYLTLAGEDLRGDAYLGFRVPKDRLSQFICNPFPIVSTLSPDSFVFPKFEEFYTITPYCVVDKAANRKSFEQAWNAPRADQQTCLF